MRPSCSPLSASCRFHLENSDPLPGPPAAWDALDAIVLDPAAMARITNGQRSALLAAGVTLASRSNSRPDENWSWQKRGSFWVLRYSPLGPVDQLVNPDAYAPTFAWSPGWPAAIRAQVAAVAVVLFLAIVAVAMLRDHRAVFGLIALSLLSAAAVAVWQHALGTVSRAGGDMIVQSPGLIQRDAWVFERARQTGEQTIPWAGWTVPIFGSAVAPVDSGIRIQIADGSASFNFQLDRGKTIAFVRREVQPGPVPTLENDRGSPMREAANAVYLGKGDRIRGQTSGSGDRWQGVVIGRGIKEE